MTIKCPLCNRIKWPAHICTNSNAPYLIRPSREYISSKKWRWMAKVLEGRLLSRYKQLADEHPDGSFVMNFAQRYHDSMVAAEKRRKG